MSPFQRRWLTWPRPHSTAGRRPARRRTVPCLARLEERALLSITINIDYTYDTSNFFNTPDKKAVMQAAANYVASELNDNLPAIQPAGGNTWTANFPDPSNGQQTTINNLSVPANTIIIYVGARSLPSQSEAGEGSTGGFNAQGSQSWLNLVAARGQTGALSATPTDYGPWGGAISFDNSGSTNWYFGSDTSGLNSSETDFFTIAEHEVGHVLGIGTAPSWSTDVSGSNFVGPASEAVYGGPVPLDPNAQHWAQSVTSDGGPAVMVPSLTDGTRRMFTTLDFAGLKDIGWNVSSNVTPSQFQFGEPSYTVSEASGSLLVTVQRSGGTGAASVQYATAGGTATAGVDYTAVSGTLNFAAGQNVQSFRIPLLNNPSPSGNVAVNVSLNNPSGSSTVVYPSAVTVNIVASGKHTLGDFDGVGFDEIGVFRPSTATWTILDNNGGHSSQYGATNLFDIPVPGDYDGIGRTEQAIFRPSTAQWIIKNPITGTQRVVSFGAKNLFDIPVPGDYDGIGRTELAVFRPSTGQWIIMNPITGTQRVIYYGATNLVDIPVPGNYDGIGRTEPAVFRPGTGRWAIYNTVANTQRFVSYGATNFVDIPIPGDYDGIGRTELAVFRPSTGQWIIQNPITGAQRVVYFGAGNLVDLPLSAPIAALKKLGRIGGIHSSSISAMSTTAAADGGQSSAGALAMAQSGTTASASSGDDGTSDAPPARQRPAQTISRKAWLAAVDALRGNWPT